ncbi:hypothetical protein TM7_0248 [candidate division TM7 genomosp. GTL1]|nr:hypothetical protein TM7_0248 [candidate division TM7 genomosp. GTL1]
MNRLTPLMLERILLGTIGLMILGAIIGFSTVDGALRQSATETNHAQIDATVGRDTIDQLRFLDTYVQKNQTTIERAASIVADSRQYSYQNQIVADINTYAARAGVSVLGYSFESTLQQKSSKRVAGLKTIDASVTLKSPILYDNFLRFLKAIEQNLTKMQVSGVSMSPDPTNAREVSNPTIVSRPTVASIWAWFVSVALWRSAPSTVENPIMAPRIMRPIVPSNIRSSIRGVRRSMIGPLWRL